jgi:hypothetical protein
MVNNLIDDKTHHKSCLVVDFGDSNINNEGIGRSSYTTNILWQN